MKKIIIVTLFCAALNNLNAQPYVFYKDDKLIVQTLDSPAVRIDSFFVAEKDKHTVNIHFASNPDWDFSVQLKKITTNRPVSKAKSKILFLSDVEGEFDLFRQFLLSAKVIDEKYNWIFGEAQLIICGDLFDRGTRVTELLWLLYKLESDAAAKGGSVHVLLGNHDIMNMTGDWRYVQPFYFEHAKLLGKEYGQLFDENTELGKWLRSKNVIEKNGDFLCMHAGFSRELLATGLDIGRLNKLSRGWFSKEKMDKLPPDVEIFFNDEAPFWYRGYFMNPFATESLVDSTLDMFNAKKIIVGHTIHTNIATYYNGKVIGIDTDWHMGNAQGLLLEDRKFYRLDSSGVKKEL